MEIVGRGFLAHNLVRIAGEHPDVVALAAGVSSTAVCSADEFQREADLVYETIRRCVAGGFRVLFFSSASAAMYAAPGCPGQEDGPVYPSNSYGRHKLAMEATLRSSDVDYVIVRMSHVVGAHQRAHQLLPGLVTQLRSGAVRVRMGEHRDVLGVDDVVSIVNSLLAVGVRRTVVNLASGYPVPVEDIIDHLQRRLGVRPVREYLQNPMYFRVCTRKLAGLVPDIEKFGFGPEYYRVVLDRYWAHYV